MDPLHGDNPVYVEFRDRFVLGQLLMVFKQVAETISVVSVGPLMEECSTAWTISWKHPGYCELVIDNFVLDQLLAVESKETVTPVSLTVSGAVTINGVTSMTARLVSATKQQTS